MSRAFDAGSLMGWVTGALLLVLGVVPRVAAADVVEYIHTDALGSPVAVTNASGVVIDRTVYGAYGEVINRPLAGGPGYTGHVEDAETGLNQMQERYYDPDTGRFLSVDPISVGKSKGSNFNRYVYANSNPYRFTDPDGRLALDDGNNDLPIVPEPEPGPDVSKSEPVTLSTVTAIAARPMPGGMPSVAGLGAAARFLGWLSARSAWPLALVWPSEISAPACEFFGGPSCGVHNEVQPNEADLTKVKERDGNKVAQDAGYDYAHDAKKGRGEGGVDIYRDKSGGNWLWNGVPGGEKESL